MEGDTTPATVGVDPHVAALGMLPPGDVAVRAFAAIGWSSVRTQDTMHFSALDR